MKPSPYAIGRFFVRSDGTLILGATIPNWGLKAGHVYEVLNILGSLSLREVGPSCASELDAMARFGVFDGFTADHIIECGGGRHLFTPDELYAKQTGGNNGKR